MRKEAHLIVVGIFMILAFAANVSAQGGATDAAIKSVIDIELKRKTIQTGTLDLYDSELDKVRNLRMIRQHEGFAERDGGYFGLIDYRDINSGDIVQIEVEVSDDAGDLSVEKFRVIDIQKLGAGEESLEDKEYSDEEIQTFMKDYVKKQTQFNDGLLMLFDKDAEKMRNLELVELKKEVRRMGIFISSSSIFKDAESGETLDIDIAVEFKKGKLSIQALRIRDVHAAPQS